MSPAICSTSSKPSARSCASLPGMQGGTTGTSTNTRSSGERAGVCAAAELEEAAAAALEDDLLLLLLAVLALLLFLPLDAAGAESDAPGVEVHPGIVEREEDLEEEEEAALLSAAAAVPGCMTVSWPSGCNAGAALVALALPASTGAGGFMSPATATSGEGPSTSRSMTMGGAGEAAALGGRPWGAEPTVAAPLSKPPPLGPSTASAV